MPHSLFYLGGMMRRGLRVRRLAAVFLALMGCGTVAATYAKGVESRGLLGTEVRVFTEDTESQFSIVAQPQWYWQSEDGRQLLASELFARYDTLDSERTHGDIRELLWTFVRESMEWRLGVGKVYWGVTESAHLVDVINQTDWVESFDGEDKLGQPMVNVSINKPWGVLDGFILPVFRERTFASVDGRLSGPLEIADGAEYESSAADRHVDFALRYSHALGDWDVGLAYFNGTNREPHLLPNDPSNPTHLIPYYDQTQQWSMDVQATIAAWLWKLELLHKRDSLGSFTAATSGFEYTIFNIGGAGMDVGLLAEYQYDDRPSEALVIGQNDVFVGSRVTLNDVQDSQFLAGLVQDLEFGQSRAVFVEANRRIGARWRLAVEARFFHSAESSDPLFVLRNQDHLAITLEYYY